MDLQEVIDSYLNNTLEYNVEEVNTLLEYLESEKVNLSSFIELYENLSKHLLYPIYCKLKTLDTKYKQVYFYTEEEYKYWLENKKYYQYPLYNIHTNVDTKQYMYSNTIDYKMDTNSKWFAQNYTDELVYFPQPHLLDEFIDKMKSVWYKQDSFGYIYFPIQQPQLTKLIDYKFLNEKTTYDICNATTYKYFKSTNLRYKIDISILVDEPLETILDLNPNLLIKSKDIIINNVIYKFRSDITLELLEKHPILLLWFDINTLQNKEEFIRYRQMIEHSTIQNINWLWEQFITEDTIKRLNFDYYPFSLLFNNYISDEFIFKHIPVEQANKKFQEYKKSERILDKPNTIYTMRILQFGFIINITRLKYDLINHMLKYIALDFDNYLFNLITNPLNLKYEDHYKNFLLRRILRI